MIPLLAILLACGPKTDQAPLATERSLHGQVPTVAMSLPDFEATAHTGASRGPGDLRGQATVLWFYPAAATAG